MLFLQEPFKSAWRGKDIFAQVQHISESAKKEAIYRQKEGRKTLRFTFEEKNYFLKHHQGVGWLEVFKNIFQLRLPVLGAGREFNAANTLVAFGVDTLSPVAFACRGNNPAKQESFLITEALDNTISLEDYCQSWIKKPPSFKNKNALIKKVAYATKTMHENGINHRDLYLCHFLLEDDAEIRIKQSAPFSCYLIDLHRCQMRKKIPYRWLVKDLGGLLFSSMDCGLGQRDYFRFLKYYSGLPLREVFNQPIWESVLTSANKLYLKEFGKAPTTSLNKAAP